MSFDDLFENMKSFILSENEKQTDKLITHMDKQISDIKERVEKEANRTDALEEQLKKEKIKNSTLSKQIRKNNVIIFNLEFKEGNLLEYAIDKLYKVLNIKLEKRDINNIYTIGNKIENKPIIIQFVSFLKKQELYSNCQKLKGTQIRISEVLNQEERIEQKALIPYLKKAKQENKKSHLIGNLLKIENKHYTVKDLETLKFEFEQQTSLIAISPTSIPDTVNTVSHTLPPNISEHKQKEPKTEETKKRKIENDSLQTEEQEKDKKPKKVKENQTQIPQDKRETRSTATASSLNINLDK